MSVVWNWLDGGLNLPTRSTRGQRIAYWWGRRLALRYGHVVAPRSCLLHPEARICPRQGQIRLGEHCVVAPSAVVQGNVTMGDHCSVQTGAVLVGYGDRQNPAGLIRLGNDVRIAPMAMLIAANHVFDDPHLPIRQQKLRPAPITVEDDVWIAGHAVITAGVTIGRGSVVAAGAVVTRDIPPLTVAAGVPAKPIRRRGDREPVCVQSVLPEPRVDRTARPT